MKATAPELDHIMTLTGLPARQFPPLVKSHGWRYLQPFEPLENGFIYTLNLREDTAVTIQVAVEEGKLACRTDTDLARADLKRLEAGLARILSLDFPMKAFRARCRERGEERWCKLAQQGWGRMLRAATPWEDAAKILCTTNVAWGNTEKMVANLVAAVDRKSPLGRRPFPTPEDVLRITRRKSAPDLKLGYRTDYLISLAREALGDNPWLLDPAPPDLSESKLYERVSAFHGFGPYAAQHLMIMMNHYGYLPVDSEVAKFLNRDAREHPGEPFDDWGAFRFPAYLLATRTATPRR